MGKNVDSVHFQHFSPYFIIFMANLPFEIWWYEHFEVEGVYGSACFAHSLNMLNVDNYGQSLNTIQNVNVIAIQL